MVLCPEHPKRDQNPKFTPLNETTSIPVIFIWESPSPTGELSISLIFEKISGLHRVQSVLAVKINLKYLLADVVKTEVRKCYPIDML